MMMQEEQSGGKTAAVRDELFAFQFLKKGIFTGSYKKMRYRIAKKEDTLEVCVYPEPFSFECTPEEEKTYQQFAFSEEGYARAKDWLEEIYSRFAE